MSELTKIVRGGFDSDGCYLGDVEYILALCDAHERLEAEHARVCNEHALLVQESGKEGRELDRLDGLLRAWWKARGDDESEASKDLWAEAARLVKAKP